jgi:HEAT repeat protein
MRGFLRLAIGINLTFILISCSKPKTEVEVVEVPEEKEANTPDNSSDDRLANLVSQLKTGNPTKRQSAIDGIIALKSNTDPIPPLLESLKDPTAAEIGKRYPGSLQSTREASVKALLGIGPKGEKALVEKGFPILKEGLRDSKPNVREHTAYAISLIGKSAKPLAPDIIPLTSDTILEVRISAYTALEAIKEVPDIPILKLLRHSDPKIVNDAAESLRWLRPSSSEAVTLLVAALKDTELEKKDEALSRFVREVAADALGRMGDKAKSAIPDLIDLIKRTTAEDLTKILKSPLPKSRTIESAAMRALRGMGKQVVPSLIPVLKDTNPAARWQIATMLEAMGSDAKEALDPLVEALQAEKEAFYVVRATACAHLQIGGDPEKPLLVLSNLLKNEDPEVRGGTVSILNRYGRKAAPLVEQIIPLLDDEKESIRREAVDVLRRIGLAAKSAVPALIKKLDDTNPDNQRRVLLVLSRFGPETTGAIPAVKKALISNNAELQEVALSLIKNLGPLAKDALPELIQLLEKETNSTKVLAIIDAIGEMSSSAKKASTALIPLTQSKDLSIRSAAILGLGRIQASDSDTLTRLTEAAQKDSFGSIRIAALKSFAMIGPEAKSAIPVLESLAKSNSPETKLWAVTALVKMNVKPEENTVIVLNAIKDTNKNNRPAQMIALDTLEYLGSNAKSIVPNLREMLKDRTPSSSEKGAKQIRQKAALALGYLGESANPTIPSIVELLKDKDPSVRRSAIESLRQLGPIAREAIQPLQEMVNQDRELGELAESAIERMQDN